MIFSNKYKLSILIPTYNRKELFKRCLLSCYDISLKYSIEFIINDNSKNPYIYKVMNNSKFKNYKSTLLNCTSRNLGEVYKELFDNATGEYIWVLEDDDYSNNNITNILDILDNYDIHIFNYRMAEDFTIQENIKRYNDMKFFNNPPKTKEGLLKWDDEFFQFPQIIFKRELLNTKEFLWNNDIKNDWNIFLAIYNGNIKYSNIVGYIQSTDGKDNISFLKYCKDSRWSNQLSKENYEEYNKTNKTI